MSAIKKTTLADGTEHLIPEGDLDYHFSAELRTALNDLSDRKATRILLDFKKVPYIDSSGIAAFVELHQKIKRYGGKLAFFNLTDSVRQVFELAKLDLFFPIATSEKEALAKITS